MTDDGRTLKEDPQGGKLYSRYERVRVERVYKEAIGKERGYQESGAQGSRIFQMNLANKSVGSDLTRLKHSHNRLEIVADKVESQTPAQRAGVKGVDPTSFEVNCMRHMDKLPTEKFDIPCTASQEVGWLIANPVRAKTIRDVARSREYAHPFALNKPAEAELASSSQPPIGFSAITKKKSRSTGALQNWPHIPKTDPHPQVVMMNKKDQWYHGRSMYEITRYADAYSSAMGANPFHSSQTR